MTWNPLRPHDARTAIDRRHHRPRAKPELEWLEDRRLLSTDVLTYRNNLARSGANLTETALTLDNVNANTFGLLFYYPVDGEVYAQPLYLSHVTLPDGSVHNIVLVATEHDSVYAFDADNPTAGPNSNGVLWQDSFIDPANDINVVLPSDVSCDKFSTEIGITATPVIDPNSGIMYVMSYTRETGRTFHQRLHALDVTTGKEALGGPVEIQASYPGTADGGDTVTFHPLDQLERAGLILANGVEYTTWSSHCDHPAHGWVIGYDAHTLQQVAVFNTSPNTGLATIWSGAAAVDADGNLFFVTGNGNTSGGDFNPNRGDYPETVLKLSTATGQLTVADYFTPYNWDALDQADEDLGSGAAMLLPDQAGPVPHLLVVAGKDGTLYLINRDNMGQFNAAFDNVVQELPGAVQGQGAYGTPAYFDAGTPDHRWVYFAGWGILCAPSSSPMMVGCQLVPRRSRLTYSPPRTAPSPVSPRMVRAMASCGLSTPATRRCCMRSMPPTWRRSSTTAVRPAPATSSTEESSFRCPPSRTVTSSSVRHTR